jgi:predicted short-subunit dehydrogenase-like oxidoreductase (DUF2520 family)
MKIPHQRIAVVGAGAVAQALGRLLFVRGGPISVTALASRTPAHAKAAAAFIDPSVCAVTIAELPGLADCVLIAVKDEAIPAVAEELARAGMHSGVALHTCGARGPDALAPLQRAGVACGVLHPLQTVATPEQGVRALEGVGWCVVGDAAAVGAGLQIAQQTGPGCVLNIAPEALSSYHAGAVMASNAIVAVLDAAVKLMGRAGIEPAAALNALGPLARASVQNVLTDGPAAALTGPVVRGDTTTVAAHLDALRGAPPEVARLYVAASRELIELARQRGLPERAIRELEGLLNSRSMERPTDKIVRIGEKVG